jgi:hypothetical protein
MSPHPSPPVGTVDLSIRQQQLFIKVAPLQRCQRFDHRVVFPPSPVDLAPALSIGLQLRERVPAETAVATSPE